MSLTINKPPLLSHRKDPDDAPLRHVGFGAHERIKSALHLLCVDTPAGLHGNILHAIDRERTRHARYAGVGAEFPQHPAGPGIEGAEMPVIRTARKDQRAPRGQHRTPVHVLVVVRPDFLAAVQIPRLQFTNMVGAWSYQQLGRVGVDAGVALPWFIGWSLGFALQRGALVLVCRNVQESRLGIVRGRWPVLATPL